MFFCLTQHSSGMFLSFCSGTWNSHKRTDPWNEPELHRVQIPTDQSTSMDQGKISHKYLTHIYSQSHEGSVSSVTNPAYKYSQVATFDNLQVFCLFSPRERKKQSDWHLVKQFEYITKVLDLTSLQNSAVTITFYLSFHCLQGLRQKKKIH